MAVLDARLYQDFATRLAGRTKRELIEIMVVHSPHAAATEKMVQALEPYPLVYLLLASEHPTQIWILDRGELVSSAEILTPQMRTRRWHSAGITIDDCEGLTDVAPTYLAMITSWKSLLIMRHEFAHVVTTFFTAEERSRLIQLYSRAGAQDHFIEPLARESIGEFVACSLTYTFFDDLARELADFDPSLYRFVLRLRQRADDFSQTFVSLDRSASC